MANRAVIVTWAWSVDENFLFRALIKISFLSYLNPLQIFPRSSGAGENVSSTFFEKWFFIVFVATRKQNTSLWLNINTIKTHTHPGDPVKSGQVWTHWRHIEDVFEMRLTVFFIGWISCMRLEIVLYIMLLHKRHFVRSGISALEDGGRKKTWRDCGVEWGAVFSSKSVFWLGCF